MAPVSLTMAILAVGLAIVSLMAYRSYVEQTILQTQVTDQWSYYQAKNIRMHEDQVAADLASIMVATDTQKAAQIRDKYKAEADRYSNDKSGIDAKARDLQDEANLQGRRADRFDLGEVFLDIAMVITSITLLSGRRMFWYAGMVLGAIGVVAGLSALLVHADSTRDRSVAQNRPISLFAPSQAGLSGKNLISVQPIGAIINQNLHRPQTAAKVEGRNSCLHEVIYANPVRASGCLDSSHRCPGCPPDLSRHFDHA